MRSARQHSEHRRLRRVLALKLKNKESSLESRSPQFGFGVPGLGNGKGDGDRGGSASNWWEEIGNRWKERLGGGRNNGDNNGNGNSNEGGHDRSPSTTAPQQTATSRQPVATPNAPSPNAPSPTQAGNNSGSNSGNSPNGSGSNDKASTFPAPVISTTANRQPSAPSSTFASQQSSQVYIGGTSASSVTSSLALTATATQTITPNFPAPNGDSSGTQSTGGPPDTAGQTSGSQKQVSASVIAGVTVVSLLLALLLLTVLLRRRWIERRSERFRHWWSNRRRNSRTYNDNFPEEKSDGFASPQTQFPTTFDRSASPLDLNSIIPAAPPLAEVRRLRNGSDAHIIDPSKSDRFSMGSVGSNGSNDSFVIHHAFGSHRVSGTESFKFPKPLSLITEATSVHSRFGSNSSNTASIAAVCSTPVSKAQPSSLSRLPVVPLAVARSNSHDSIPNPFADSESIVNPFVDSPIENQFPFSLETFSQYETIRRPFQPSLRDELAVNVNDQVQIIQIYEDGWALVDKIDARNTAEAKKGLIPLACLHEAGQDISSLLHTKRVQSFQVSHQMSD